MKQETLEEPKCTCKEHDPYCCQVHGSCPTCVKKKEEPKQTDENGKPITYWGGLEEPKQETLEDAAERYSLELLVSKAIQPHEKTFIKSIFIQTAKSDAAKDYWYSQFQQSKWVQVEKIKAQIEMLEGVDGVYYYAIPISRKIESLQKQLKQLEDEN
jgi:hypothetical protein